MGILASASCPVSPLPKAGALSQLSLQRCLEEEYTGVPQASEATLEPTLAGEDPKEAPEHADSCSPAHTVHTPRAAGRCVSEVPLLQS